MPHNSSDACHHHPILGFSEEPFEAVVELADTIRNLTDPLGQVQQTLDFYEVGLLHAEPKILKGHAQPDANTLEQWQEFIECASQELDALIYSFGQNA